MFLGLAVCWFIAIVALVVVVSQRGPGSRTLVGLLLALLPIPLLVALHPVPRPARAGAARALLAAICGAGAGIAAITALLGRALNSGVIATPELDPQAIVGGDGVGGRGDRRCAPRGDADGLVLLALLASRRTEIDGMEVGVVYGSMVGLGFALVANVYAYAVAWNAGAGAIAEEFAGRGVFGPVLQALSTSLIGLEDQAEDAAPHLTRHPSATPGRSSYTSANFSRKPRPTLTP